MTLVEILVVLAIAAVVAGCRIGLLQHRTHAHRANNDKNNDASEKGRLLQSAPDPSDKKAAAEKTSPSTHVEIESMPDTFNWETTTPLKLRPFKPRYHITMGLQTDTPSNLIVIDRNYRDRVLSRHDILGSEPRTFGVLPSFNDSPVIVRDAVHELYTYLLRDYLPARYPSMFHTTESVFHNTVTGTHYPLMNHHDLDPLQTLKVIGETVEDDMFLLLQQDNPTPGSEGAGGEGGEHTAVAFVCCHPAGFDPSEKLGKLLKDVHGPVPAYEKIGPSMERYFARLEAGKPVKRVNWSVQTHGRLFAPTGNHVYEGDAVQVDEDINPNDANLRVELQTLTRVPGNTRAILFSFKTYLYPLTDIKTEGLGPQLADAIEGLKEGNAPGMWVYKGGVRWGKAVCEFLRS
ncbi:hrq family protein 2 [Diplogelasinospora grovesii]|uniref:Hrq family protein 2 n=1 Tax=Diplogelasinospora grovesii TaxID=303347 RepID=A0AAN6NBS3_9PEZI|nr:hrq family protein 2 [Diplogelasinospora grovesii]